MTSRRTQNLRGFTLIELILVMVIIAIMSAVVAPVLRGFSEGRRLSNATSQMLSVANWARAHAISDGVTYRLYFNLDDRKYWLMMQGDEGTFVEVRQEFGQDFTFPDKIEFSCDAPNQDDGQYVEFFPSGRLTPATIRLVDTTSNQETKVGSLSATEVFHIFSDDERSSGSAI